MIKDYVYLTREAGEHAIEFPDNVEEFVTYKVAKKDEKRTTLQAIKTYVKDALAFLVKLFFIMQLFFEYSAVFLKFSIKLKMKNFNSSWQNVKFHFSDYTTEEN